MNPPMVNIVWLDTNECSMSAWQTKDELLASQVCTIDSIGYLMADREDCVIPLSYATSQFTEYFGEMWVCQSH